MGAVGTHTHARARTHTHTHTQVLGAPQQEVVHVRRFCMSQVSATNLAHLFYQVCVQA